MKRLLLILTAFSLLPICREVRAQEQTNRILTRADSVNSLPSQNKRWALLIGVDKYQDSNISSLRGAANDANSLREVLIKYAGFPQDQVVVLSTAEPAERQPTRSNILKRLSNLSGLVPNDGLLLFSFAGHGIERNGQAFLIPSDATLTEDLGLLEDTAVSVTQIKKRIKDATIKQVMIFLDACRSYPTGRSDSANPLTPGFMRAFDFRANNNEVTAFAVLYATAVGHRAYEYTEKHQGYFSWAIAQALSGGAANIKGEVTLHA
ncbi:MAG TPA: caspase family protein, partial [Pyrinomonadaceae bacterium]|nr:caspase family protein [Pyrinomonadaceae bacterium]